MKKQLVLGLGLAVLAAPAFASKARLEALGEDNFGSYYIQDNRNIFLNAAKVNENKDMATYEFGSSSTGTAVTADAPGTPKAEGGFLKGHGNMVYGAHFGNSTPLAITVRGLAGTNLQERNPFDLFIGGDAGVKWGANLTYENFDGGSATTRLASNALRARVGVVSGASEAFLQASVKGYAKDFQGNEADGKASYYAGVGHLLNGNKFFLDYKHVSTDYTAAATTTVDKSWTYDQIRLGVGRQEKMNDRLTGYAKVMVDYSKVNDKGNATVSALAGTPTAATAKITTLILPVNLGFEYDAVSWLQLRGSVSQYVYSNQESKITGSGKKNNSLANTVVRAGASIKFGELSLDGLLSTFDPNAGGVTGNATTNSGKGSLNTSTLMTRVSATYRF